MTKTIPVSTLRRKMSMSAMNTRNAGKGRGEKMANIRNAEEKIHSHVGKDQKKTNSSAATKQEETKSKAHKKKERTERVSSSLKESTLSVKEQLRKNKKIMIANHGDENGSYVACEDCAMWTWFTEAQELMDILKKYKYICVRCVEYKNVSLKLDKLSEEREVLRNRIAVLTSNNIDRDDHTYAQVLQGAPSLNVDKDAPVTHNLDTTEDLSESTPSIANTDKNSEKTELFVQSCRMTDLKDTNEKLKQELATYKLMLHDRKKVTVPEKSKAVQIANPKKSAKMEKDSNKTKGKMQTKTAQNTAKNSGKPHSIEPAPTGHSKKEEKKKMEDKNIANTYIFHNERLQELAGLLTATYPKEILKEGYKGTKFTTLMVGDSQMRGILADRGEKVTCIAGGGIDDLIWNTANKLHKMEEEGRIILQIGGNSIKEFTVRDHTEIVKLFMKFVLTQYPDVSLAIVPVFPRSYEGQFFEYKRNHVNHILREVSKYFQIEVLYDNETTYWWNDKLARDGVHLNKWGKIGLIKAVAEHIKTAKQKIQQPERRPKQ